MRDIAQGSVDKILAQVMDPVHATDIKRASFESALAGIRSGVMTYQNDPILPLIEAEMQERLQKFQGLTPEEEGKLLQITEDQKKYVVDNDRKLKNEFLGAGPAISHGTVKNSEKYKNYMNMVHSATH